MTLTVAERAASLPAGPKVPADAVPAPAAADLTAATGETNPSTLACQREGFFFRRRACPGARRRGLRATEPGRASLRQPDNPSCAGPGASATSRRCPVP